MGKDDRPPSLDELGERLRAAREHQGAERQGKNEPDGRPADLSGLGWAFRIGVEMVSALAVGVGVGLALDWWLGTSPLFLLVFFVLGAGAAFVNVYRAAMGYGLGVGYRNNGKGRGAGDDQAEGQGTEGKSNGG